MNLGELRGWVRRQSREVSASVVPDAEIDSYINEGYRHLANSTASLRADIEVTLVASALEVTLPAYGFGVVRAQVKNDKLLRTTGVRQLETIYGTDWRNESNATSPDYILPLSPQSFRVIPFIAPGESSVVLEFYCCISPGSESGNPFPYLTSDSNSPLIPTAYHLALAYYTLREIMLRDVTNPEMGARGRSYETLLLAMLESIRQSTNSIEGGLLAGPIPSLPAAPMGQGGPTR